MQSKLKRKTLNVGVFLKFGKLRALRTVPRKIQQILKLAEIKILPTAKITARTISKFPQTLKLVEVKIAPLSKSRINTKIPTTKLELPNGKDYQFSY